jgi:predicted alpha-1,2-mannosidase
MCLPQHERAGTRTVEYAYNDYCISLVAKGLGKQDISAKYLQRSQNWKNLWKPIYDSGSKGFIMPRNANGEWDETYQGRKWEGEKGWQPTKFTPHIGGTWPDFFYEASSWEYSFYVPHDVHGLIELCGGNEAFINRLDTFFARNYYNVGNEPSFLTATLYNYIGRQDKTLETVRRIISEHYNASSSGIPGNDDSGSMSAWLAFHLMGFYPNAGQDLYLITAPHFNKVTIHLENDSPLVIEAKNLSKENVYIQAVMFNGKELTRSWFRHTEILQGGKLEFLMGNKPNNNWETKLPPPNKNNSPNR